MRTRPSPFSPGDIILNWIAKILFSAWLPAEIWTRLPGILWGAGTLFVAFSIADRFKLYFLPWFTAFSVSLMSFSAEMRPYASLIFAGALSAEMILGTETSSRIKSSRKKQALIWFSLVFTHIYGICFIGLASFWRKEWKRTLFAIAYVLAILFQFKIATPGTESGAIQNPHLGDLIRQIAGTLGNPHKASYVLLPAFIIGLIAIARQMPKKTLALLSLFVAAVVAPVIATYKSGYFFVPRQTLGGMFTFLFLCSFGFKAILSSKVGKFKSIKIGVSLVAIAAAVLPWILTIALNKPPFPNQPRHRFREIVDSAFANNSRNILNLNACQHASFEHYIERHLGKVVFTKKRIDVEGIQLIKQCWDAKVCVVSTIETQFCSEDAAMLEAGGSLRTLISKVANEFDIIVYSATNFQPTPTDSHKFIRSW